MKRLVMALAVCGLVCLPVLAGGRADIGRFNQGVVLDDDPTMEDGVKLEADLNVDPTTVFYWHDRLNNVIGITALGQLVYLEMPAGMMHFRSGSDEFSGYGMWYWNESDSIDEYAFELGRYSSGSFELKSFATSRKKSEVYPGNLVTEPLIVVATGKSLDGAIKVQSKIRWKPETQDVLLTLTVKNLTKDRLYVEPWLGLDIEPNLTPGTEDDYDVNYFTRSSHAVMAWNSAYYNDACAVTVEGLGQSSSSDVWTDLCCRYSMYPHDHLGSAAYSEGDYAACVGFFAEIGKGDKHKFESKVSVK